MFGLHFLQMSLLVPLYRHHKAGPRALPVRFEEVPALKRPRRRADDQEWATYRRAVKRTNLSTHALESLHGLRQSLDQAGAQRQRLLIVGDGSFCNRTLFSTAVERTEVVARARKNIKLCSRATDGSRRFYGTAKFTPEAIRQDERRPWFKARIFHGGQWRKVRYKEVSEIYWQSGSRKRPLRVLVVAPIPYQPPGRRRKYYRDPAYLLTTDRSGTPRELLQAYFDRWQIEVNHREEKDTLGVGQAQVRSPKSVPRQPALVVAAYSALLLAGLLAFGPGRSDVYAPLPKWRRNACRPSCLDLVSLLRKELDDAQRVLQPLGFSISWKALGSAADG